MKCGSMTFRNNYDGTCDGGRILKINVTDHKKYTVHICNNLQTAGAGVYGSACVCACVCVRVH